MAERVFRIERIHGGKDIQADNDSPAGSDVQHRQIMGALTNIKTMLAGSASAEPVETNASDTVFEKYRAEMAEALKLKGELDSIRSAITDTKSEIASLHHSALDGIDHPRVSDELDAVVVGTEQATETILSAAEIIDENANNLAAKLNGDDQGMASDIQEKVVAIFEACNFQDVTGQRITKVVTALRFIDERVNSMMEIWGGIESFADVSTVSMEKANGDAALLNGPALVTDEDSASQDDIDALFD